MINLKKMVSTKACFFTGMRVQIETDTIKKIIDFVDKGEIRPGLFGVLASESARSLAETTKGGAACGVDSELVRLTEKLREAVEKNKIPDSKGLLKKIDEVIWARAFETMYES